MHMGLCPDPCQSLHASYVHVANHPTTTTYATYVLSFMYVLGYVLMGHILRTGLSALVSSHPVVTSGNANL